MRGILGGDWQVTVLSQNVSEIDIPFVFCNLLQAASWCLTSVVFINCYTGVLTSILAAPSYMPSIKNLEELASSKIMKPVTIKSTAVDDIMLVIICLFNYFRPYSR